MQEITNEADMISICNYCQKPGQENRFGSFYCKECKAGLTDK